MVDFAGGGLAESASETVQSLSDIDEWVDVGDVAANTAGVALDALGYVANPIDTLASSAIGWLIEHLAPLRAALDATAGNPVSVQNAVARWNDTAVALDAVARAYGSVAERMAPTWTGGGSASARTCAEAMDLRTEQVYGASMACVDMAEHTAVTGALIAAARGVIRDLIASYVWELCEKAIAKLAVAPFTFGASTAEFTVDALIRMSKLLKKIDRVVDTLVDRLQDVIPRISSCATFFDAVAGLTRRGEMAAWFPGKLLPNLVGIPGKFGVDVARETTKVHTTETRSNQTGGNAEIVQERHRRHDAGENQEGRPARVDDATPPGPYETEDWWSRRGTL
jgi:hypothetical protein